MEHAGYQHIVEHNKTELGSYMQHICTFMHLIGYNPNNMKPLLTKLALTFSTGAISAQPHSTLRKALLVLILSLASASLSFAQYAVRPAEDITLTKEYKIAKNTRTAGIVIASTGAAAWLCGGVMCVVEENRYINSHSVSGNIEEIYNLKQEAKRQPSYKKGQAVEIAGYVMMLAGAGTIWIGQSKIKKLKNSAAQPTAILDYGLNGTAIALALKF